jgi:Mn2+/Fe2+ NRAMP family transporter
VSGRGHPSGPAILVGIGMDFSGDGPVRPLSLAAILSSVVAPPLLVLIVLLGRPKTVHGRHRSGLLSQPLVGATAVAMAILSVLAVR